jgi:hypothetical protein
MTQTYAEFLERKSIVTVPTGIESVPKLNSCLFDFQRDITKWALNRGRAAVFAGTGLGKTLMQVEAAKQIEAHTKKPLLIFAPLAVASQTIEQAAELLKYHVLFAKTQADIGGRGIYITNYQKREHFDPGAFGGVILDESSCLKSEDAQTRKSLVEEWKECAFRMAFTATPAPNDFMEIGGHAEFLGVMTTAEMLSTFFVHDGGETSKWRLKGHAEKDFWRWMASWCIALQHPRDLGYDDARYDLPPLNVQVIRVASPPAEGELFSGVAQTLQERRGARRDSIDGRLAACYELAHGKFQSVEMVSRKQSELHSGAKTGAQEIHGGISQEESRKVETHSGATGSDQCGEKSEVCERSSVSKILSGSCQKVSARQSRNKEGSASEKIRDHISGLSEHDEGSKELMPDLRIQESGSEIILSNGGSLSQEKQSEGNPVLKLQSRLGEIQGQSEASIAGNQISEKWAVWCCLNVEQDTIARMLGKQCVSIQGSTPDEKKIELEHEWRTGATPVMITKAKVFGYGMNWQHCHNVIYLPDDSFEAYFQAVRRFWRFGQKHTVNVWLIVSEAEQAVLENLKRKEREAREMYAKLITNMADFTRASLKASGARTTLEYKPKKEMKLPDWLTSEQNNQ